MKKDLIHDIALWGQYNPVFTSMKVNNFIMLEKIRYIPQMSYIQEKLNASVPQWLFSGFYNKDKHKIISVTSFWDLGIL